MADFPQMLTPAEMQVQQQAIDRQRAIATALQQQSMAPEQGQMISGHYVPSSNLSFIAKLAQGLIGGSNQRDLDQKQLALATQQGDLTRSQFGIGQSNSSQPTQASSSDSLQSGLAQGAAAGSLGPTPDNLQRVASALQNQPVQASQPQNSMLIPGMDKYVGYQAYNTDPKAYFGKLLELGVKNAEDTPEMKNARWMGRSSQELAQEQRAAAQKAAMYEMQPGATATNFLTGKTTFNPKVGEGITLDQNGNASPVPGYSDANAGIEAAKAAAIAAAQAGQKVQIVQTKNGPQPVTEKQLINEATGANSGIPGQAPTQEEANKITPELLAYLKVNDPQTYDAAILHLAQTGQNPKMQSAIQFQSPAEQKAQEAFAGGRATAAADYGKQLDDTVKTGNDLKQRMIEARQALSQFTPGMGAETRLNIARFAQSVGASDDLVRRINNGDIASKQEFQKLSAQTAMESLKQAMGGSGRITQAEFQVFQHNNPNIELDPRAIEKMYDFADKIQKRNFSEQQSYDKFVNEKHGDPSRFPAWYANQQMTAQPDSRLPSSNIDSLLKKYGAIK